METVARASSMIQYGDIETFSLPDTPMEIFNPHDPAIKKFSPGEEIEKCRSVMAEIIRHYPGATIDMGISSSESRVDLVNSSGLDLSYESSYYSASLSVTYVQKDGARVDVWEGLSSRKPEPVKGLMERALSSLGLAMERASAPGGTIPVLMSVKALARMMGILLSGFNGKSVHKGTSPFAGRLREKAFNEKLTVWDNPRAAGSPYSFPFDDEGTPSFAKPLIENGIIQNFVTDLKHAEKLGTTPSGNASRGYSTLPAPGFSSIVIEKGTEALDEIISTMERGLLVDQFIGLGQSNTLTGDFSAGLDLAFLIENGKITGRVKDAMIADNLFRLLAGDITLSRETGISGSVTSPHILFPSVNFTC